MKRLQIIFCVCCLLSLPHTLRAAALQNYVIGWGSNQGGQATGIPSIRYTNGAFLMDDNPSATGVVTIASQMLSDGLVISAGVSHSLALKSDGTVVGWGGNSSGGALGSPTPYPGRTNGVVRINGQILSNVVSVVASRTFSLALKEHGTLIAWGENYVPAGLTNISAIAAAGFTSLVLKNDGTVIEWESEKSLPQCGQLREIWGLSNVVAVAIGESAQGTRSLALKKDGTVAHWGEETVYKDATPPAGLSNVVAIAAGYNHSLALNNDGTVIGWGFNNFGQATGIPTTNSPNISAGRVTIGGQILNNVVSIAASHEYSLALKKDGTVIAWGHIANDQSATIPAGLSNVVAIAAGDNFCLAITTNTAVAEKFRR